MNIDDTPLRLLPSAALGTSSRLNLSHAGTLAFHIKRVGPDRAAEAICAVLEKHSPARSRARIYSILAKTSEITENFVACQRL